MTWTRTKESESRAWATARSRTHRPHDPKPTTANSVTSAPTGQPGSGPDTGPSKPDVAKTVPNGVTPSRVPQLPLWRGSTSGLTECTDAIPGASIDGRSPAG